MYETQIRNRVREAYSGAAEQPEVSHPFPIGREFAESVGYPRALLAGLPAVSIEAFCGVSNVSVFAEIPAGAAVLDLGCGAGLDSLIAAQRAGPQGRVIGVDFSGSMLARARQALAEAGMDNVILCHAGAEQLPIKSESIDVALINGIFNLNPARQEILRELARVMRNGGTVFAAELIRRGPAAPSESLPADEANWFA